MILCAETFASRRECFGRLQFGVVALAVGQAQRVAVVALFAGDGECGDGIESTGEKDDGFFHGVEFIKLQFLLRQPGFVGAPCRRDLYILNRACKALLQLLYLTLPGRLAARFVVPENLV